jgi:polyisoprenoid-binding protein YceI
MKKHFLYLFLFFVFISCTDEVKFNNPSFEGQKDNVFWRAIDSKAAIAVDGSLTIAGYTRNEKLTLKTTSTTAQSYPLGTSTSKMATYVLTDASGTVTFSTGYGKGDGEIVIEKYDAVNKTVTGTFKFNAVNVNNNPLAGPILNFQYGHFYKIPVSTSTL